MKQDLIVFALLAAAILWLVILVAPQQHDPNPAPLPAPAPAPAPTPTVKPTLLYFSGPNCVYCRQMEQTTLVDPAVKAYLDANYAFVKATPEQVRQYRINGIPAYVVVSPTGTETKRASGYKSPAEFLAWLKGG